MRAILATIDASKGLPDFDSSVRVNPSPIETAAADTSLTRKYTSGISSTSSDGLGMKLKNARVEFVTAAAVMDASVILSPKPNPCAEDFRTEPAAVGFGPAANLAADLWVTPPTVVVFGRECAPPVFTLDLDTILALSVATRLSAYRPTPTARVLGFAIDVLTGKLGVRVSHGGRHDSADSSYGKCDDSYGKLPHDFPVPFRAGTFTVLPFLRFGAVRFPLSTIMLYIDVSYFLAIVAYVSLLDFTL